MRPSRAPFALVALLALGGCGGAAPAPRLDGAAAAYRAGEPVFVLDAVARVRDGSPGIEVFLGLPPASVVFRPTGDAFRAVAGWTVTVEREGGAPVSRTPVDTLGAAGPVAARSPAPRWRTERFDVAPGTYLVRAVLDDRASNRTAERRVEVEVPGPSAGPTLGGVRLEAEDEGGAVGPVDAFGVPARLDSLRAVVQALHLPDGAATAFAVVRLHADTAAAARVIDPTPGLGSLAARGVDGSGLDTVQTVRQPIENPAAELDVVAPLPALRPGVYRAEVRLLARDGAVLDTAERLFVVRRRDYPQVSRLGDLLGPLEYLASPDAVDAIREARSPTARRRAFDRFWGDALDDRRVAAATVRAYYERVEEANRLFATYKEGWQTDRGMAFVLFGPPRFIEQTVDGERWTYGGGGAMPVVLDFEVTAGGRVDASPFEVLTLRRGRGYEEAWRSVRRQWREGIVP